jgi:signal transduction histidine kinase
MERNFNLKQYVQEVIDNLGPNIRNTKHSIIIEGPDDLVISHYPGAFSHIVTNIVMNALIHAFTEDQDGIIKISIWKTDDRMVVLDFSDNGKGIESNIIDKIFDPFFTTNRARGGTGLGLHIIYNIVTQTLKGTIECDSKLNQGTRFLVKFPIDKEIKEVDIK